MKMKFKRKFEELEEMKWEQQVRYVRRKGKKAKEDIHGVEIRENNK